MGKPKQESAGADALAEWLAACAVVESETRNAIDTKDVRLLNRPRLFQAMRTIVNAPGIAFEPFDGAGSRGLDAETAERMQKAFSKGGGLLFAYCDIAADCIAVCSTIKARFYAGKLHTAIFDCTGTDATGRRMRQFAGVPDWFASLYMESQTRQSVSGGQPGGQPPKRKHPKTRFPIARVAREFLRARCKKDGTTEFVSFTRAGFAKLLDRGKESVAGRTLNFGLLNESWETITKAAQDWNQRQRVYVRKHGQKRIVVGFTRNQNMMLYGESGKRDGR